MDKLMTALSSFLVLHLSLSDLCRHPPNSRPFTADPRAGADQLYRRW